jgi:hypothetical protein
MSGRAFEGGDAMKPVLLLSLALLLPAAGAAANDDPPPRKDGLWNLTIEGGAKPITVVMCVDAASEQKTLAKGRELMAGRCSKMEMHRSGNTFTQDSVCDLMGSKRISHSVTTLVDDATLATTTSIKYDPPKPGLRDQETKQTMKWVGPCGADLKPGQTIVNGKVITTPGN